MNEIECQGEGCGRMAEKIDDKSDEIYTYLKNNNYDMKRYPSQSLIHITYR